METIIKTPGQWKHLIRNTKRSSSGSENYSQKNKSVPVSIISSRHHVHLLLKLLLRLLIDQAWPHPAIKGHLYPGCEPRLKMVRFGHVWKMYCCGDSWRNWLKVIDLKFFNCWNVLKVGSDLKHNDYMLKYSGMPIPASRLERLLKFP